MFAGDWVTGEITAASPSHGTPAAAILLVEAIEVARNIGTNNILLPILGDSHIDMKNPRDVDTFVAMMKEVARHAEKAGVVVALEDWISAEDNILIGRTRSGRITSECITMRGTSACACTIGTVSPTRLAKRIHQVHVKNGPKLMRDTGARRLASARHAVPLHRISRVVRAGDRSAFGGI